MSFDLKRILLPVAAVACMESANAEAPVERMLVTGSYAPLPVTGLTSTVSIIDADRIAALNKRNVADLLKSVPGVLVEQQGGPGGLTAVSLRGGESNFTLVLLDGIQVNDPTNSRGGSFDFASLDPATIDRIEIIRGPQSSVYGSDALAGVINIVSKRGAERASGNLRGQWGEDDFRRVDVQTTGSAGAVRYAASLSHRDDGEPVAGSQRETDIAQLLLDWSPAEGHDLQVNLRYLEGERTSYPEQSGGPLLAATADLDRNDYRDLTALFGWRARITDFWRSEVRLSWFDHDEEFDSPGIAPFTSVPPNFAETEFERGFLHWINSLAIDDQTNVHVGVDHRSENGESTGAVVFGGFPIPTDFSLDRGTTGYFAELHRAVGESIALQGSIRYDDPDGFPSQTTFAAGMRWRMTERVELSANWGEAFKIPSFFALGHGLVGNPDLRPETAESWDVTLQWQLRPELDFRATWFDNRYDDLIDFDPERFVNVNRSEVESRGAELEMSWAPTEGVDLLAYGSWTDLDVVGETSVLTGRPEWKAGAIGRWQLSPSLLGAVEYRWSDDQFAASRHTGETIVDQLDTIEQLDLNIAWAAQESLTVEVAIDNALDQDYETAIGFPAPGRLLRIGVTYDW